jgi:hypothetical protein
MTWQIKAAVGFAIACVLALIVWFGIHEYHTVLTDNQQIGAQAVVIKGQDTTIVQQASTAAVTDTVVGQAVVADQAAAATGSKIDAWVASQTSQINSNYANPSQVVTAPAGASGAATTKPVTKPYPVLNIPTAPVKTITSDQAGDVVPQGQDAEVSAVQLTGSWMKYCAAIDNADAKCTGLPQAQ